MKTDSTYRRYEFDWLRLVAILVVFLYHSSRFFNLGDWHVKNINTYAWVEVWNIYATRWMMPLFFIISGAGLFYAIGKSSVWKNFYVNKFLRLMVPVLVASVTHSAFQVYLERLSHGQFSGSFVSFLPEYFNGVYIGIGMPGNFAFHGMHLWYLLFLFIYSLLCYHLFFWLKGKGQPFLDWITAPTAMPGLMYLWFLVPLLIMEALIPQAALSVGNGGWGFLHYIWFLISGFIIVSNDRLQHQIRKQRWISLLLGVVLSTMYLYQLFSPSRMVFPDGINGWVHTLLNFLSAWSWLFAILGFGMHHLAFDRPWRKYANEGILPFFILHQTVLLGFGYIIIGWQIHDTLKWAIIFGVSFISIITCYAVLILKFDLFRFLFGMKTRHPFFDVFQNKWVLIFLHALFIGLIIFAAVNQISGAGGSRAPMPLTYDPVQDIVLDSDSITNRSSTGIRVVKDQAASKGHAIEFFAGANEKAASNPEVYFEMRFPAPAGRYFIWLRGKTDVDNGYTDSVWLQADEQIGTQGIRFRLGNWLDVHSAGNYGWAGDTDDPISIELKYTGEHIIRIQPRQIPHRIDQIFLSRTQYRIPNTVKPIKIERED